MSILSVYKLSDALVVRTDDDGIIMTVPYPSTLPAAKEIDEWINMGGNIMDYQNINTKTEK